MANSPSAVPSLDITLATFVAGQGDLLSALKINRTPRSRTESNVRALAQWANLYDDWMLAMVARLSDEQWVGGTLRVGGARVYAVTGDPEGVQVANPGDLAMSDNGTIYAKATGTGDTGWSALGVSTPSNLVVDKADAANVDFVTLRVTGTDRWNARFTDTESITFRQHDGAGVYSDDALELTDTADAYLGGASTGEVRLRGTEVRVTSGSLAPANDAGATLGTTAGGVLGWSSLIISPDDTDGAQVYKLGGEVAEWARFFEDGTTRRIHRFDAAESFVWEWWSAGSPIGVQLEAYADGDLDLGPDSTNVSINTVNLFTAATVTLPNTVFVAQGAGALFVGDGSHAASLAINVLGGATRTMASFRFGGVDQIRQRITAAGDFEIWDATAALWQLAQSGAQTVHGDIVGSANSWDVGSAATPFVEGHFDNLFLGGVQQTAGVADGTVLDAALRWSGSAWVEAPTICLQADGDILLISPSGSMTVGDGTGQSFLASDMSGASTQTFLTVQHAGVPQWDYRTSAAGTHIWRNAAAGTALSLTQTNTFNVFGSTVTTVDGSIGNELALSTDATAATNYIHTVDKAADGTSQFRFLVAGATPAGAFQFIHGADESFRVARFDGASTWDQLLGFVGLDVTLGLAGQTVTVPASLTVTGVQIDMQGATTALTNANAGLYVGDGAGSPTVNVRAVGTGTGIQYWMKGVTAAADNNYRFLHNTDESFRIQQYYSAAWNNIMSLGAGANHVDFAGDIIVGGVTMSAGIADGTTTDAMLRWSGSAWVEETSALLTTSGNLTLNTANPLATVGAGTGSPILTVDSGDAGFADVTWAEQGQRRWQIRKEATNHNLTLTAYNAIGTLLGTPLSIVNSSLDVTLGVAGQTVTVPANLTLSAASPIVRFGDATGSPSALYKKVGTGSTVVAYYNIDETPSDGDFRHLHGTTETFALQAYYSATWNNVWSVPSASNTVTFGGDVTIGGVTQSAGIADGTTTDAMLRWSGSAWVEEPNALVDVNGNPTFDASNALATFGDDSGSPQIHLHAAEASVADVRWYSTTLDWAARSDVTSRDFLIQRYVAGVFQDNPINITNSSGAMSVGVAGQTVTVPANDLIVNSTNARALIGDATGSPQALLRAVGTGTNILYFLKGTTAAVDNNYRMLHGTDEAFHFQRHDTTWVQVWSVADPASSTVTFGGDIIVGGVTMSAGIADGTTSGAMLYWNTSAWVEDTEIRRAGAGIFYVDNEIQVGDDLGNAQLNVAKAAGSTGQVLFQSAAFNRWGIQHINGGDIRLERFDAAGTNQSRVWVADGPTGDFDIVSAWRFELTNTDLTSVAGARLNVGGGLGTFAKTSSLVEIIGSGDLLLSDTVTTATNKISRLASLSYTTVEEPWLLAYGTATTSHNTAYIGGGDGGRNSATRVNLVTSNALNTLTGTIQWRVDHNGYLTSIAGNRLNVGGGLETFEETTTVAEFIGASGWQLLTSNVTNLTQKNAVWACNHYTSDTEEPHIAMWLVSGVAAADLYIGGGSASANSVENIYFYTAASHTTTTGTLAWQIDSVHAFRPGVTDAHDIGTPTWRVNTAHANHLYMVEQAAASSNGATTSLVWTRNDAPNRLIFTDDTDADHVLAFTSELPSGVADGTVTNSILRWSSTEWVEEASVLLDTAGNITAEGQLRSNGPSGGRVTVGDALGDPILQLQKLNNSYINFRQSSGDTTGDWRWHHNSIESIDVDRYNGATWDQYVTYQSGLIQILSAWRFDSGDDLTSVAGARLSVGGGLGATPTGVLDLFGSAGVVRIESVSTDATQKDFSIRSAHYTNAEEDVVLLSSASQASNTFLSLGGSGSGFNFPTIIRFATAATATTTTATDHWEITASGHLVPINSGRDIGDTNDGTRYHYEEEQASAPSPTAGFGATWSQNSTPSTHMYTDDAGDDHPMSFGQEIHLGVHNVVVSPSDGFTIMDTGAAGDVAAVWSDTSSTNRPYINFVNEVSDDRCAVWNLVMPATYAGGGVTLTIRWHPNTTNTGTCTWAAAFERNETTFGYTSAAAFAAEQSIGDAGGGTGNASQLTTIAFTDAQIDGVQAGDAFRLVIRRSGGDGFTGAAFLSSARLMETNSLAEAA